MSAPRPYVEPMQRVVNGSKPFRGTYWQCVDHVRDHGGYIVSGGSEARDPDHQHDLRKNGAVA